MSALAVLFLLALMPFVNLISMPAMGATLISVLAFAPILVVAFAYCAGTYEQRRGR